MAAELNPQTVRLCQCDDPEGRQDAAALRESHVQEIGRPPLDRRNRIGIAAQRLVEHDGNAQARPELGQAVDFGVRHGLFEGGRAESH